MTNDSKPLMFGSSSVIEPVGYEPRSGKRCWIAGSDLADLQAASADTAHTVLANAKLYTHEEVMRSMQERIDRA